MRSSIISVAFAAVLSMTACESWTINGVEGQGLNSGNAARQFSDERLKEDIVPVTKLENGIQLYTFNYKGDPRRFVGVIAQDLLKDEKFAEAVSEGPDGYYRVDYSRLGMRVTNPAEMLEAGLKSAARL